MTVLPTSLLSRLRARLSPAPTHDRLCEYADTLVARYAQEWGDAPAEWQQSHDGRLFRARLSSLRAWTEAVKTLAVPDLYLYHESSCHELDVDAL